MIVAGQLNLETKKFILRVLIFAFAFTARVREACTKCSRMKVRKACKESNYGESFDFVITHTSSLIDLQGSIGHIRF